LPGCLKMRIINKLVMKPDSNILPNFLVVGTMKAGTTTLHDILRQHSQIFLPSEKEIHFFDRDETFHKGINYYSSFFAEAKPNQIVGEITPIYIFNPKVPERIVQTLGKNIKLIFIFRNPANRFYSHYKMRVLRGEEKRSLNQILNHELTMFNNGIIYHDYFNFILRGFYARQVERYLSLFPRKQLFFVLFEEDFIKNRKQTIENILTFLGVSNENLILNIKSFQSKPIFSKRFYTLLNSSNILLNSTKVLIPSKKIRILLKAKLSSLNAGKGHFPDEEFKQIKSQLIRDVYIDDIKKLEKLINRDLSNWYNEFV